MTGQAPIILFAGATGLIGRTLMVHLLANGYQVFSLTRRTSRLRHEKLHELIFDFDTLLQEGASALRSLPAPDIVISTLGTTLKTAGSKAAFSKVDRDYVVALGTAARARGAKKMLVVSSVSADAKGRSFYLRTKGEMEDALIGLGYPRLDIFRPGLLLGERPEFRLGERVAMRIMPLISRFLPDRYHAVAADDVALAMAQCVDWMTEGTYVLHNAEILRLKLKFLD